MTLHDRYSSKIDGLIVSLFMHHHRKPQSHEERAELIGLLVRVVRNDALEEAAGICEQGNPPAEECIFKTEEAISRMRAALAHDIRAAKEKA